MTTKVNSTIGEVITDYKPDPNEKPNITTVLTEHLPFIEAALKRFFPETLTEKTLESYNCNLVSIANSKWDTEILNKAINNPIRDLLNRGGKRWRSILMILIAQALGKEIHSDFVIFPEIIHNGTLVIDDIEDDSDTRRGAPCVHKIYGNDVAINAGNAMYYLPLSIFSRWKSKLSSDLLCKLYEIYSTEMIYVHLGQATDIGWHSTNPHLTHSSPTITTYLQMCACKTGALARMSVKIALCLCNANKNQENAVISFSECMGTAFQIQDDLLNIMKNELSSLKGGIGEDIHEGKRTLMVIHTLENGTQKDRERLLEILNMKTNDMDLKKEAISIMERNGSLEFSEKIANQIVSDAWAQVEKAFPDSVPKSKLKIITDYLISSRTK